MPTLTRINREQITFSNLESQVAPDREISFIDALVHSKSPEMRETLKVRKWAGFICFQLLMSLLLRHHKILQ